ncbi:hypothetical protein C3495_07880 [Clostridiaceae bacterium 14S0207]|nr:hypothetical protein C3495_07880 [Clostridiaceae bacterium 14S0207]
MKKFLAFFCIISCLFFAACSTLPLKFNNAKNEENNSLILYCSNVIKPMADSIVKDVNLNSKYKIEIKTIDEAEVDSILKKGKEACVFIGFEERQTENIAIETIGKDGIGIITSAGSKLENINFENLRDIYSGKVNRFEDNPNKENIIKFVMFDDNNTLRKKFNKQVMEFPSKIMYDSKVEVVNTMDEMISKVKQEGYIGYTNLQYGKSNGIKTLKLNGVHFSKDSIKTLTYPLTYNLNVIYDKKYKKESQEFINYLKSIQGKRTIENFAVGT